MRAFIKNIEVAVKATEMPDPVVDFAMAVVPKVFLLVQAHIDDDYCSEEDHEQWLAAHGIKVQFDDNLLKEKANAFRTDG